MGNVVLERPLPRVGRLASDWGKRRSKMVAATRGSRGSGVISLVLGELRRSPAKAGEVENVRGFRGR